MHKPKTGALTQDYTYDVRGNRATMTVTGTESYAVSYAYDANNRLLTEQKTQGLLTDLTTYAYDADGNLLSKTVLAGNGGAAGSTYVYNTLNQLVSATENQRTAAYAYNTQGIRTAKVTFSTRTNYLLDGGNVVGEHIGSKTVTYLRGANLISRTGDDGTDFYLFNAHGDVTGLADSTGVSTRAYDYDAFGVEKDPDPLDENPFRYCGEYFDRETETYYLRARYYDPTIGRFTQQDTHWTTANSIYGDNPQKINEHEDKLGLKLYSYAPQITAVMQSGNLYVYGVGNPVYYVDETGELAWPGEIHNQVVLHIAQKHGLYREQIIQYDVGFGRADLISFDGKVWEVKPNKERHIARGEKQVAKYTQGIWKHCPNPVIGELEIGGETANSIIIGGSFVYETSLATYYITYQYVGNGVITYDYYEITDWVKVGELVFGTIAIAGIVYLVCVTGGAAIPVLTIV